MKALIQRVINAKVTVNDEVVSSIGQGVCVFVGISNNDTTKDMEHIARKILNMKLFDDENNKRWKKSVVDKQLEILCVSQFTLYNTWKGNKPDFHNAMPGDKSKEFYENFLQLLREQYHTDKIKDGEFGAYMQVSIQNDGPVTFEIESPLNIATKEPKTRSRGDAQNSQNDTNKHLEETKDS
ncbi:D-aminoacyl-tRNA deacylase [Hyposmocoma kahamanoa]|uniref:D-aminoacyl-tRNA deacylase n=1 Tax=Hyposmocoma kahamanoa TaxID=1477025 RepID=UPI000E6D5D68|nr:D-aminoacyl-tRNA deacylase [Hyposmocoma kahamanoa]